MAFFKHDFHYDEGEHKQEVERIRHQQSIQKEWLDQQIAEKARLNQEGRRDGRINHEEYEHFEERRIARFKYNLIRRIVENWSSVTSFDWAEANQLAQVDSKFKEALEAAKANHEAKERSKAQRQEELQKMQLERLEKEKESARNRNANLGFDIDDPYSKLINASRPTQAALSRPHGDANEGMQAQVRAQEQEQMTVRSGYDSAKSNNSKAVVLPPLKTAQARAATPASGSTSLQSEQQIQGLGVNAEQYSPAYNAPIGIGYPALPQPIYLPQPPQPVQIIAPPQSNHSEMKALLEILQEQKKGILQNDADVHVEKMFEYFQCKLQEIIASNEKNIEAAVCDGVRKELEEKLSDLRLLMSNIEQKRLESKEKKTRTACAIERPQEQVDAETSMSPKEHGPTKPSIAISQAPIPRSPEADTRQSYGNGHYKYQQLSLDDPVDKIVTVLKERNANRKVALKLRKIDGEPPQEPPDKAKSTPLSALAADGDAVNIANQPTVNPKLKSILNHLTELEQGESGSLGQKADCSGLLSATEFINRVLQDLKDSGNPASP
ncbi:hypothetical protein GL50803_0015777 [Giardia duodenalis]|uniref:Uncharacterized protein n=1 Tax=Giardia intestinalis (strain ATCC 50803 / WB clone C6) TaxID=184922 RepID=A8BLM7_GIAIC|nr:hypothetical protein GL50803_0015777 [Giardia intestinalis]KAE8302789.1 hypothetical protein GL50803_0015777 [Giardia intestinalis]|eukprot:XP_001706327.1 Hypothetical protein GL50803_15777 [Giardia lamblia ATCC 50803]